MGNDLLGHVEQVFENHYSSEYPVVEQDEDHVAMVHGAPGMLYPRIMEELAESRLFVLADADLHDRYDLTLIIGRVRSVEDMMSKHNILRARSLPPKALEVFDSMEGEFTPSDISDKLGIRNQNVSKYIDNLKKQDVVHRVTDVDMENPDNRKKYYVRDQEFLEWWKSQDEVV